MKTTEDIERVSAQRGVARDLSQGRIRTPENGDTRERGMVMRDVFGYEAEPRFLEMDRKSLDEVESMLDRSGDSVVQRLWHDMVRFTRAAIQETDPGVTGVVRKRTGKAREQDQAVANYIGHALTNIMTERREGPLSTHMFHMAARCRIWLDDHPESDPVRNESGTPSP